MIERFINGLMAVLIAADQLVLSLILWPLHTASDRFKEPDPDETISGVLGASVKRGERWAIWPAAAVDWFFRIITLGADANHTRDVARWEAERRCKIITYLRRD